MPLSSLNRAFGLGCLFVYVGLLTGCSGSEADVSGKVTIDGKPIPSGKIVFLCEGGAKPVLTADIRDGRYSFEKVPAGKVVITVSAATYRFDAVPNMPKGMKAGDSPSGEGPGAPPAPTKGPPIVVPPRYGDPAKSDLSFVVSGSGKVEHDVQLTP